MLVIKKMDDGRIATRPRSTKIKKSPTRPFSSAQFKSGFPEFAKLKKPI
jgi:hypothetical protein